MSFLSAGLGFVKSKAKAIFITAIATIAAGTIAATVVYIKSCEQCKARYDVLEQLNQNLYTTIDDNEAALQSCLAANEQNALAALTAKAKADAAAERVAELEASTNDTLEAITHDAEEARGMDNSCRTLDDPLPGWFADILRE